MPRDVSFLRRNALGWSVYALVFLMAVAAAMQARANSTVLHYAWPLGLIAT